MKQIRRKETEMMRRIHRVSYTVLLLAAAAIVGTGTAPAYAAWEPTKPVEFIVPAGAGGASDQMARTIQGIIMKHKLMKQPV
ncbi:MAG TPA: hypothetical protein VLZ10_13475, partial [Thermodesulfobacteriota bacterium]|nr:hypothetical protein [Thermodesulfobacteriota bacterium]